ncbi:MAG TPA: DegT/DnrJ/EryC1/StrS family aminotransferase [Bryobacteraceae bacterium]|nr:DegT/DnrJ/EryC1/StrS family aminotransferase [Bryobacteraceae bacterium]
MNTTHRKGIPVAQPVIGPDEEQAVTDVLRSGWISQGLRVAEFESKFAQYVGAPQAVAVSSCTTALHLALMASGISPGDEVLCPSLSFIATANAIAYTGATPVFIDVDLATYNMDPSRAREAITSRTKAILLVHQVGLPAAIGAFCQIANDFGLLLIEDAACAIGSEYQGLRIGLPHSSMACFSFHPRKILTTGEGGMITCSEESTAARLRRLRQHAMSVSDLARHSAHRVITEHYSEIGYNYRMTDLQAAIGVAQLRHLDQMLETRRKLAEYYTTRLSAIPWIICPSEPPTLRHNYQSYMVRLRSDAPMSRDDLAQRLLDQGIASRRGIMAIHREAPYRNDHWDRTLPFTNLLTDTTLILPLFCGMTEEEQDQVVECIRKAGAN